MTTHLHRCPACEQTYADACSTPLPSTAPCDVHAEGAVSVEYHGTTYRLDAVAADALADYGDAVAEGRMTNEQAVRRTLRTYGYLA